MHRDDLLGSIWRDGLGLAEAAEAAGLDRPVPSCPGWSVADLVWHIGEVHRFWTTVVAEGMTDPNDYVEPDRPPDTELVAWYREGVDRCVRVLTEAPPDRPVWSWSSAGEASWVVRRMAHETAVHRWDAEQAAGRDHDIDPALAVDGVDEFFEHFTVRTADGAEPLGGTVHLHATDAPGEWIVEEVDAAAPLAVRREHAKGDAAVRAPAPTLLLALWRRVPVPEALGDATVAARLFARTNLD